MPTLKNLLIIITKSSVLNKKFYKDLIVAILSNEPGIPKQLHELQSGAKSGFSKANFHCFE